MNIDIKHLAKLSRLSVTPEDEQRFEPQMQSIIAMVEHLPQINIDDSLVDPTTPMTCREDVPLNAFKRDDILCNAPQVKAGCVVVPKVIE